MALQLDLSQYRRDKRPLSPAPPGTLPTRERADDGNGANDEDEDTAAAILAALSLSDEPKTILSTHSTGLPSKISKIPARGGLPTHARQTTTTIHPAPNALIHAFLNSYRTGQALVLRPDDIWLTLLIQLSRCINDAAGDMDEEKRYLSAAEVEARWMASNGTRRRLAKPDAGKTRWLVRWLSAKDGIAMPLPELATNCTIGLPNAVGAGSDGTRNVDRRIHMRRLVETGWTTSTAVDAEARTVAFASMVGWLYQWCYDVHPLPGREGNTGAAEDEDQEMEDSNETAGSNGMEGSNLNQMGETGNNVDLTVDWENMYVAFRRLSTFLPNGDGSPAIWWGGVLNLIGGFIEHAKDSHSVDTCKFWQSFLKIHDDGTISGEINLLYFWDLEGNNIFEPQYAGGMQTKLAAAAAAAAETARKKAKREDSAGSFTPDGDDAPRPKKKKRMNRELQSLVGEAGWKQRPEGHEILGVFLGPSAAPSPAKKPTNPTEVRVYQECIPPNIASISFGKVNDERRGEGADAVVGACEMLVGTVAVQDSEAASAATGDKKPLQPLTSWFFFTDEKARQKGVEQFERDRKRDEKKEKMRLVQRRKVYLEKMEEMRLKELGMWSDGEDDGDDWDEGQPPVAVDDEDDGDYLPF